MRNNEKEHLKLTPSQKDYTELILQGKDEGQRKIDIKYRSRGKKVKN